MSNSEINTFENVCRVHTIRQVLCEFSMFIIAVCFLFLINIRDDIEFYGDLGKKSESQTGFEPTTLRDLVGRSKPLSYWRLYGEQGLICGSRLEPHHAATQPSNDWHT